MGNAIVAVHADMYQTMVLQASSYGPPKSTLARITFKTEHTFHVEVDDVRE